MVVHSFTGIFEHIPEISQFCVVQETLEGITILYIPGEGFRESLLDEIRLQIQHNLDEPFPVHFQQVDHISPTASGKPQLIISKIKSQNQPIA
jgi:phenylacetate-CoA ligase